MPTPTKRTVPSISISTNETKEVKLQRGYLEESVTIVLEGSVSLADGTPYNRASHIREVELKADNGVTLHAWKGADLMVEQEIMEGLPYALMAHRSGTTFRDIVHLNFRQLWCRAELAGLTMLPTWMYDNLTLRITCGNRADVAASGTGTITNATLTVYQNGVADPVIPAEFGGDAVAWGAALGKTVRRYQEVAIAGAGEITPVEIARTADIRSILVRSVTSAGVESDNIFSAFSLRINNNIRQFESSYHPQRAENARTYGVTPPTGYMVIDSAEDRDISEIFEATGFAALHFHATALAAGTLRLAYNTIEPGA